MTTYSTGVDDLALVGVTANGYGYFEISKVEPTLSERIITTAKLTATLDADGSASVVESPRRTRSR